MSIETKVLAKPMALSLGSFNRMMPVVYLLLVFSVLGIPLIPVLIIGFKVWENKQVRTVRENGLRVFKEFVGGGTKHIDVVEGISKQKTANLTPTGLATDGANIYVMDDGVGAKIPWAQVRNWGWSTNDAPVRYGRTGLGGLQDDVANKEAAVDAYKNSGFFVSVADVEKPEWQFMTSDEALLKKWMEIFTQIDEGALPQTAHSS